ncbi:flagellar basal body L-ring protein FlgH [Solimonas marina]|uniref:Flagellar L-ring protein n=1 Tax=Solimonas marina TaxID=2714601 RepID=A0A970B3Y1_9GAMM|nr:flagellar basal body L-ring protein FlgH [Solimonas marina]NKF21757.1 flagellar basal body L-ring protein FlgH [Solimonas marina]
MRSFAILACLSLAACATTSPREDPYVPPEAAAAPAPASDGSIYSGGSGLALFEDNKARRVGDLLTVNLVEQTNAEKKANTSTAKTTSDSIANPTLFGRPVSVNGTGVLGFDLGSDQAFTGSGASTQSNKLSGSVTVIVTRVLPNGNLVVRGEKQIQINQGSEHVALQGIVRPIDIAADGTVPSSRVANAKISYAGNGAVADSNAMGWLARFFNSVLFPF